VVNATKESGMSNPKQTETTADEDKDQLRLENQKRPRNRTLTILEFSFDVYSIKILFYLLYNTN
jgi:hypothetical protein